nr:GNAT family N-acetyltransferase [Acidimicrobiia bacterium]
GFKRFMNFAGHTDKIHKAAAPLPHYYLFAMGVHPSAQGKGRGSFLLERMLERIDREKMPAYLEVQNERNLALYRRCGFEVAGEGEFPGSNGHYNWGMLRPGAH